jgi:diguanylate cyclase (GGDEF)-like protein
VSDERLLKERPVWAAVGLTSLFVVVLVIGPGGVRVARSVDDVVLLLAAALAAALSGQTAHGSGGVHRRAWMLLALSALAWTAARATSCYLELLEGERTQFPSVANVGYLLGVALGLMALFAFTKPPERSEGRWRTLLDGLVVAGPIVILSWGVVRQGAHLVRGADGIGSVLWIAYQVLDATWLLGWLLVALSARRALAATSRAGTAPREWLSDVSSCGAVLMLLIAVGVRWHVGAAADDRMFWTGLVVLVLAVGRQFLTRLDNDRLHADVRSREERFHCLVQRAFDAALLERRAFQARLLYEARHDSLTGLPNRLGLDEKVTAATGGLALLFVNLDGFKLVNGSFGHLSGDAVLAQVARRLESLARSGDTVARFGGDSFVVVRPGEQDGPTACAAAARLIRAIGQPLIIDGRELVVSASVGIALQPTGPADPVRLLREADAAMYEAKAQGRGRCQLFDSTVHDRIVERVELERELRQALNAGDLRVRYQPVVSIPDGEVRGFEALVRWIHPRRGPIGPSDFIPVAEESGLIVPIGEWVLREACRQAVEWNRGRATPLTMAVNLSARQMADIDPVALVAQVLGESGMPAEQLTIEITESAVMADPEQSASMLRQLRALGIRISVDDFGTGYSSLAYLQRFPFSTIKVDASFTARLATEDGAAIVNAILRLADALGLRTVAEGVESMAQVEQLWRLGCHDAQGFYFSSPLRADEVGVLLGREMHEMGDRPGR